MRERRPIVVYRSAAQKYWLPVGVVLAVSASLLVGKLWGSRIFQRDTVAVATLENNVAALQIQLHKSATQVNQLQLDVAVDATALENSRQEMVRLQQQIYQRDQELKLYRELLQDNSGPNGLSVSDLQLQQSDDGRIRYRWVARQKTAEMKKLRVLAEIWVLGEQNDQQVSLSLAKLDDQIDSLPIKLEFKYFAISQGVMRLPEGLEPSKVRITLRYNWIDKVQFDQSFDWKIED